MKRVLVVGAGLYGATIARRLFEAGHEVMVVERRDHIAGNAYTRWDEETGVHEHVYGAHIFHTDQEHVWRYVNGFAEFAPYRHTVRALAHDTLYPFPINLLTLHQVFGVSTPQQARAAMSDDSEPCDEIVNMEQYCLHHIGRTLYELFIRGYTCKQWGVEPRTLPASIIKRIPVRLTHNDAYFNDRWQGIPTDGYTRMVQRMLDQIPVLLATDFLLDRDWWIKDHDVVVCSGAIDEFFGYSQGELGYRSLSFRREYVSAPDAQGCAVINHCDLADLHTRVIEHRHFSGSPRGKRSLVSYEYSSGEGEPFYPINTGKNQQLLETYRKLAQEHFPTVEFGGRLGSYCYLDMHQVIASALAKSRELLGRL